MDPDAALERRVRRAGVHDVEDAVDRLVALDAENGGAENLLRVSVDDDFHEAERFVSLDGATDSSHRTLADEEGSTKGTRLRLGEPRASEGRIDVERTAGNSVVEMRRGSSSSRFAAAISKSLYEVWVKAPRPLQSPSAQMPATLVRSWSSTTT